MSFLTATPPPTLWLRPYRSLASANHRCSSDGLVASIAQVAPRLNGMSLVRLCVACRKLRWRDWPLWSALLAAVRQRVSGVRAGEVFTVLHCMASNLSNTLWSLAKLTHCDKRVVDELSEKAMKKAADFNEQELANTLWSLAKLNHYKKAVVDELCEKAMKKAADFNEQNLSNTL
uniref:FAST kinase leucine-rich domain-containing protein n=1 Tax=Chromera velia CCMP2878 TaxID=1169474 RepID=A0A0G4FC13_9ALVE|eukprot:Cvel_16122.t1-p1 / transcript=Cvel_16122.t1 / gene=Cvel_16122 / organism=Chromera_velia_CCMP2878 / gene_product=hypothetical protein / transcript_product=hypothetical protein / location=Cvel_scaffold1226:37931-38535(-) / protein_length=174 / sequence_SO=supercontig / SO=protein_coding / is_pseudo=false